MAAHIEFFYDVASPYTWLAATQIQGVAERAGASLSWRPFLLGGVFKATGNLPPATLAPRGRYMLRDLGRWAQHLDVPFNFPRVFPINSLLPMRVLQGMPREERPEPSLSIFKAYWVDGKDVSKREVLVDLLGEERVAKADDLTIKGRLRIATEEAVARGAFGSPTIFVGDEMFFGNDRLLFVEQAAREA